MRSENARDVLIIGGGVTGLTLALSLHEAGIPCRVYEAAHERTGDKPFGRVEDVVSEEELAALMEKYKRVAGFERETLKSRPSLVSP